MSIGKLPVVWSGTIHGGKLTITYRDDFAEYLKSIKDGDVEIIIRRARGGRGATVPQRKYYWPVIVAMWSVILDCSSDDAHESLLVWYAMDRCEPGQPVRVLSTSEMDSPLEVENYFQWCRDKARKDANVLIPLPRQVMADPEDYGDPDDKKK